MTSGPLSGTGSDAPVLSDEPKGLFFNGNAGAHGDIDDAGMGSMHGIAAWIFPLAQTSSNPFIIGLVRVGSIFTNNGRVADCRREAPRPPCSR